MDQKAQPGPASPPVATARPDARTEKPLRIHVDPLGRPLFQGTSSFTDQQVGGDLTGNESDARDDNFVVTGSGQNHRDVSGNPEHLSAVSSDSQRYLLVEPIGPPESPEHPPQPDGTEDPGSSADDELASRPAAAATASAKRSQ